MLASCWRRLVVAALLVLGGGQGVVRAGLVRDVAFGLGFVGFDIQGRKNPLDGGVDLLVNRNFIGNPLSFGASDLTLQGPLSFQVSTSGGGFSQLEISLTTALDGSSTAVPLNYVFNTDTGVQSTQVSGSLLIDSAISINGLGFYNWDLSLSSRQDVNRSGLFANDDEEFDFDIGPISLSGNIFADVLALITDPIFAQAGQTNPFASFSGKASLSASLIGSADSARKQLAAGGDPVEEDRAKVLAAVLSAGRLTDPFAQSELFKLSAGLSSSAGGEVVPEPTVLVLMLLGLPAVMGRRLPRRTASR